MVDFNLSTSLPPLAAGSMGIGRRETIDSVAYSKDSKPLPENFALKLEESEQSLNFEFSESKIPGIGGSGH
jgi:hypothetical protein